MGIKNILMMMTTVKILTRKNIGTNTLALETRTVVNVAAVTSMEVNAMAAMSMAVSGLLAMVAQESRITLEPAETMASLDTGAGLAVAATTNMRAERTDESRVTPEVVEMKTSTVAVVRPGLDTEVERLSASLDTLEAAEKRTSIAAAARLGTMGTAAPTGVKCLLDMAAAAIPTVEKQVVATAPIPMDEAPRTPMVVLMFRLVAMAAMTMIIRAMAALDLPTVVTKLNRCPADLGTMMKVKVTVALVTAAMAALLVAPGMVVMIVSRCLVGLAVVIMMMRESDAVATISRCASAVGY